MDVLTPPENLDSVTWVNLPLNDKIQYILDNLGKGDNSNPPPLPYISIEVINLTSSEYTKAFEEGAILDSLFIDTPIDATFSVNIGTTPFGADIEEDFPVVGLTNPKPFMYEYYFKTSETWYFSGLPSTGKLILVYKSANASNNGGGGGGVTSYNQLTDKPFTDEEVFKLKQFLIINNVV
jgi:hypothetical protein